MINVPLKSCLLYCRMCGDRIGSIFKMRHLYYPELPSVWPKNFEEGKKLKHFFFHRYLPFSNNYRLTFVLCLNLKFRKESSWSNLRGCSSSSRFLHTQFTTSCRSTKFKQGRQQDSVEHAVKSSQKKGKAHRDRPA